MLTPRGQAGEVDPELDEARGLHSLGAVLALVKVDHAGALQERQLGHLPEEEERAAREASLHPERLGVLDGEADPEAHAGRGELDALEGEVGAEADLL
eukprot:1770799-Alexandrium_andersonii.AAC.1